MLAIRMQRTGRKGHAMFRVVVQDSRLTPSSGRVVAKTKRSTIFLTEPSHLPGWSACWKAKASHCLLGLKKPLKRPKLPAILKNCVRISQKLSKLLLRLLQPRQPKPPKKTALFPQTKLPKSLSLNTPRCNW
jgi:hypothetical protein